METVYLQGSRLQKRLAVAEAILNTAENIATLAKQLPRTGKKGRNVIRKKYSRSPQNRNKQKLIFSSIMLAAYTSRANIHRILLTPIPRFEKGGLYGSSLIGGKEGPESIKGL